MGLLYLCLRLPGLDTIRSNRCVLLSELALIRCQRLLGRPLEYLLVTEDV